MDSVLVMTPAWSRPYYWHWSVFLTPMRYWCLWGWKQWLMETETSSCNPYRQCSKNPSTSGHVLQTHYCSVWDRISSRPSWIERQCNHMNHYESSNTVHWTLCNAYFVECCMFASNPTDRKTIVPMCMCYKTDVYWKCFSTMFEDIPFVTILSDFGPVG
jgi:hypothetical protein